MKFDFYLSEMSVSDKHGGGLTLQRILGDDLDDIAHFIHVNRFAADLPARNEFLKRSKDLLSVWESDFMRKLIGRSRASKISMMLWAIQTRANMAARKMAAIFNDKQVITGLVCPQGANAIFALEALKKRKKVKYITWVMDDHLVRYVDDRWQYPEGTEGVFARHLRGAEKVLVISPTMQRFYKERFGVVSTVLFGSSGLLQGAGQFEVKQGSLKIGYFGAVAAWQKDALAAVAAALKGTDVQLDIYSGIEKLPAELEVDGLHFKGSVAPELVLAHMQNYDAVLLPISFKQKMRNMSEFNIATKMSEYLACGVPILAVGPAYAAMIAYLDEHDAAITVVSTEENAIRDGFKYLRNPQLVARILKNAQKLVVDEVGSMPMRGVWQAVVNG
ncbi:glycosyltransferase family protein [Mucilaginibacter psychrotolerans]|uniref:Glycosyltransferase n=1 Tax=Mucilaginibacter psychrotolerans TaxID=1524096 RepID=A0A4Y8SJI6_9SPHI|nr:hypothetical protein [Mucilaginibacter psychrotolerans]TFF38820.1 hypothetical protein E2R66_07380 [Mucilaginibacter psychrotolerans]